MFDMNGITDPNDMHAVILDFPQQLLRGIEAARAVAVSGPFATAIVCGMGGSAMATAEHLQALATAQGSNAAVWVHRSYDLPAGVTGSALVIASSYSGNTEETLSAYDAAMERGCTVIAVTTGGKLAERARRDGVALVELQTKGVPPRLAVGESSAATLTVLGRAGIIPSPEAELKDIAAWLKPKTYEPEAKELAAGLKNRIPLVYASDRWKVTARSWKAAFNENAKIPAFWNHFPELTHNELAGFSAPTGNPAAALASPIAVVMLTDPAEEPRMARRTAITAELLRSHGVAVHDVAIDGTTPLAKIFSTVIRGHLVSYHLALGYGIDPVAIEIVEDLKQRLATPHSQARGTSS